MALWLQHLLVLILVAGCLAVVMVQIVRTLRGKKSKLGACCAKGCEPAPAAKPQAGERVAFFPSDMLTSSARKQS